MLADVSSAAELLIYSDYDWDDFDSLSFQKTGSKEMDFALADKFEF